MELLTKRERELIKIGKELADILVKTTCQFMSKRSAELTRTEQATVPLAAIGNLVAVCAAGFNGDPQDWIDEFKANLDRKEVREYMIAIREGFLEAKRKDEIKGVPK